MSTLFYFEITIMILSILCYFLSTAKELSFGQRMSFLGIAASIQILLIPFELLLKQSYSLSLALFGIFGLKIALTAFINAKNTNITTNIKEEEWLLK